MSLVSLAKILENAKEKGYGVGMFNVMNGDMIKAVIAAAESEKSPVIIAFAEAHKSYQDLSLFSKQLVNAALASNVPVCVHCDHGTSFEFVVACIANGFSSVMFDGSLLPYKDNEERTAEIVKIAHAVGCSVEGELGHVGLAEGGEDDGHECVYTDPGLVPGYVNRTGVDALAVSIGTQHGMYRSVPKLDLELLSRINASSPAYLVLHGGSGLSDNDFIHCIRRGITKINIYTDLSLAATEYAARNTGVPYTQLVEGMIDSIYNEVRAKMRLFGSSGQSLL